MDQRTKKLLSDVRRAPWIAAQWKSCREDKVAVKLFPLVDEAIFDRDFKRALALGHAFVGMANSKKDPHLRSKAAAALGSAFRAIGLLDMAIDQLNEAKNLARSCDDCLGNFHKRLAMVFHDKGDFEQALALFDQALAHFERTIDRSEICSVLLGKSHMHGRLRHSSQGFGNARDAIGLMNSEMPFRYFVSAAFNALALAADTGNAENVIEALRMIGDLRTMTKGHREHARTRAILRYVRGLAYDKAGNQKNATRTLENAISTLDRLRMLPEKKTAMADLARIRCKGRQIEPNERSIVRLLDQAIQLETDDEILALLEQARINPTERTILTWRSTLRSYVPSMEPIAESTAIL